MPKLTIDNREVEVPQQATILEAARRLGIDIPTLCYLEGCPPSTSCLVCTVRVLGNGRLVPSCATLAADGMQVESETEEIHQVRRSALELLLSDHLGDCLAPCQFACPAGMDIPQMLRQIAAGDAGGAIVTVKRDIALPAVLGRICPAPCEKACRRRMPAGGTVGLSNRAGATAGQAGSATHGAVSICLLKRFVADADLASSACYLPECRPPSGRRVAIIGAGPAGWSAAYYLLQQGHACTIFDENPQPGGRLRHETSADDLPRVAGVDGRVAGVDERVAGVERSSPPDGRIPEGELPRVAGAEQSEPPARPIPGGEPTNASRRCPLAPGHPEAEGLPREVLDADLQPVVRLGAELRMNTRIGDKVAFEGLRREFDAVLVACGATAKQQAEAWGLETAQRGVQVAQDTYETSLAGVFAAGNAIRGKGLVIRSAADGKEAASAIDQYLSGRKVTGPKKPFSTRIGRLEEDELALYLAGASQSPRQDPAAGLAAGFTPQEAVEQSARCMHCDCRGLQTCKLRHYADLYGADPRRYKDTRKPFRQDRQHAAVIYEPGKCIQCGLCIEIAAQAGEPLGLTFIGRGFDVRVGVPFDASLREALQTAAAQCVAACPTAALSSAEDDPRWKLPILPQS